MILCCPQQTVLRVLSNWVIGVPQASGHVLRCRERFAGQRDNPVGERLAIDDGLLSGDRRTRINTHDTDIGRDPPMALAGRSGSQ